MTKAGRDHGASIHLHDRFEVAENGILRCGVATGTARDEEAHGPTFSVATDEGHWFADDHCLLLPPLEDNDVLATCDVLGSAIQRRLVAVAPSLTVHRARAFCFRVRQPNARGNRFAAVSAAGTKISGGPTPRDALVHLALHLYVQLDALGDPRDAGVLEWARECLRTLDLPGRYAAPDAWTVLRAVAEGATRSGLTFRDEWLQVVAAARAGGPPSPLEATLPPGTAASETEVE